MLLLLRFGLLFHDALPCGWPSTRPKGWCWADERGVNRLWRGPQQITGASATALQLGDVCRYSARLIAGERRGSRSRVVEMYVGELLPAAHRLPANHHTIKTITMRNSNLINIHGVATFNCASGEGRTCSPLILHSPVSNVRDFLGDLMMFLQ